MVLTMKPGSTARLPHLLEKMCNHSSLTKCISVGLRHFLDAMSLALSGITPNLQPVIPKLLQLKYLC